MLIAYVHLVAYHLVWMKAGTWRNGHYPNPCNCGAPSNELLGSWDITNLPCFDRKWYILPHWILRDNLLWKFKVLHYLVVWLENSCVLNFHTIKDAEIYGAVTVGSTNGVHVRMFVNRVTDPKLPLQVTHCGITSNALTTTKIWFSDRLTYCTHSCHLVKLWVEKWKRLLIPELNSLPPVQFACEGPFTCVCSLGCRIKLCSCKKV
jgi:hypothetical protein